MEKQWYNIYVECIKDNASITAKIGEVLFVGKIKARGWCLQRVKQFKKQLENILGHIIDKE